MMDLSGIKLFISFAIACLLGTIWTAVFALFFWLFAIDVSAWWAFGVCVVIGTPIGSRLIR